MEKNEVLDFPNLGHRLIILDDDPTGIQAVQGCLVLTAWDAATLKTAFNDKVPFFFILTNTRALTTRDAKQTIANVVADVVKISLELKQQVTFLIRSDSTLRGHFPLELETVLEAANFKPDARFFVSAFFEGGRVTENNNHYLIQNGKRIACDKTEFARDSVFGYSTSYLPEYIREKTSGRVKSENVLSIGRYILDGNHEDELDDFISNLSEDKYVVINAVNYDELNRFSASLKKAFHRGRKFVFQSAASLVKSLTGCISQGYLVRKTNSGSGLIIVGSHVDKTTRQLSDLLTKAQHVKPIEIDVSRLLEMQEVVMHEVQELITICWEKGETPVIYTSRKEISFNDKQTRLAAGLKISSFLNQIVKTYPFQPSFCISKGGITSHEILSGGLAVRIARVLGQVAAGVPMIEMPTEHRWAKMPYIIFPGNVGEDTTLTEVYKRLTETD